MPAGGGDFFPSWLGFQKKNGSQNFFEKVCLPLFKTFRIMVRDLIVLDWIFMILHHCILFPSQPLPFYQKCQDIFQRILVNQIGVSTHAEMEFLKKDEEYQKRREKSLQQDKILKSMNPPKDIMDQVDLLTCSINDYSFSRRSMSS